MYNCIKTDELSLKPDQHFTKIYQTLPHNPIKPKDKNIKKSFTTRNSLPAINDPIKNLHSELDEIVTQRSYLQGKLKTKKYQLDKLKELTERFIICSQQQKTNLLLKEQKYQNCHDQIQTLKQNNLIYRNIIQRTKDDLILDAKKVKQMRHNYQTLQKVVIRLEKQIIITENQKNTLVMAKKQTKEHNKKQTLQMHRSISLAKKTILMEERHSIALNKLGQTKQQTLRDISRRSISNELIKKYRAQKLLLLLLQQKYQRLKENNQEYENGYSIIAGQNLECTEQIKDISHLYFKSFQTYKVFKQEIKVLEERQKTVQQKQTKLSQQETSLKDMMLSTFSLFKNSANYQNQNNKLKVKQNSNKWDSIKLWVQRQMEFLLPEKSIQDNIKSNEEITNIFLDIIKCINQMI